MGDRLRLGQVLRHPLAWAVIAGVVVIAVVSVIRADDDGPPAVSGTPKQAVDLVETFRKALAARDFATICDELYTVEAREAAGGDDCQSVLAQETAKLRDPQVKIVGLTVRRDGAVVNVQASVRGDQAVEDTITLVREKGKFRIASAGPPVEER